jgi:hypothetical protein
MAEKKMSDQKNYKYFIFQDKPGLKVPKYRHDLAKKDVKRLVYLDKEVVPGAEFYCEGRWILPGPGDKTKPEMDEHTHPFGELLGFFGFNYEDVHDLGAEIEFWIDGEKYILKESFSAFIPAGIKHGPLYIRDVKRPVFNVCSGAGSKYE